MNEDNVSSDLSDALAAAVERAGRAIVSISARRRSPASGIVWQSDIVVTADHVVERDEGITVTGADGVKREATLAGRDPTSDLAILTVKGLAQQPLAAATSQARVGQIVLAVARPGEAGLSASFGVLSAVGSEFRTHGGGKIDQFLRPDLTFYPGFSGGPLIDATGKFLGLNTSGLARGLPLTIPASTVSRVVEQLLKSGHVKRGYLGVRMQSVEIPAAVAQKLDLKRSRGLLVVGVEADGPGEKAGVMVGDIVVSIAGKPFNESDSVQSLLEPETVGTTVTIGVVRGGEARDVQVVVGERPVRRHRHG